MEAECVKADPPVRVLVQTLTHLVPGRERRWASHNDFFAYDDLWCYFLVDYGEAPEDAKVPILSYEWTEWCLKPKPELAQHPRVLRKLKKYYPFTRKPRPHNPEHCPRPRRHSIKKMLERDANLNRTDLQHLREHPEDIKWLKENLPLDLWLNFLDDQYPRIFTRRHYLWRYPRPPFKEPEEVEDSEDSENTEENEETEDTADTEGTGEASITSLLSA
ncbi:hypothetical protein BO94DRAFT_624399 [Aspergillus sclerotioniger CBS 115572]|uniref:Uncharacterized protein n=1 Tax=Aspergillus sclerotioniger CBS 115572 TaxID=1450535 RepID=A0A317WQL4_9EURO|nr:hypothetical protein BO94DRAFT_624399 [Aspergillus sclerotioniger CBS 115572]PWY87218.1 hypothetical protein BO94DRAFT_624399 [Aspergillus sclerotioniger CBS 115572]